MPAGRWGGRASLEEEHRDPWVVGRQAPDSRSFLAVVVGGRAVLLLSDDWILYSRQAGTGWTGQDQFPEKKLIPWLKYMIFSYLYDVYFIGIRVLGDNTLLC